MKAFEFPRTATQMHEVDGLVVLRVINRDNNDLPMFDLEIKPDEADEMASTLTLLAAKARRDGVRY